MSLKKYKIRKVELIYIEYVDEIEAKTHEEAVEQAELLHEKYEGKIIGGGTDTVEAEEIK